MAGDEHQRPHLHPGWLGRSSPLFTALQCALAFGSSSRSRTRSEQDRRPPANAVFLPLLFISGVFYSADNLLGALEDGGGGAAAQAPGRRLLAGDRRLGRTPARPRSWAPGRSLGLFLAVRYPLVALGDTRAQVRRHPRCPLSIAQHPNHRQRQGPFLEPQRAPASAAQPGCAPPGRGAGQELQKRE